MLKNGQLFEEYQILQLVSSKTKTQVYSAKNTHNNQFVAIKLALKTNAQAAKRIEEEGCILSEIDHPNIVHLVKSGQNKTHTYIVTEFLEGVSLNRITPKEKGLPLQTIWPFLEMIENGLTALHQKHIVHLDLKPSNILVTYENDKKACIKLIDFDHAKKLDTLALKNWKPSGTPGYVAPELLSKKIQISTQSDIYAFGAVLAFLLTGQAPYTAEKNDFVLAKQLNQEPDALHRSFIKQSKPLQSFIRLCMNKDPSKRPKDLKSTMKLLEKIKDDTTSCPSK